MPDVHQVAASGLPAGGDALVALDLLGVRVEAECGSVERAGRLRKQWSRCVSIGGSASNRVLHVQRAELESLDGAAGDQLVSSHLTARAVAATASRHLAVHAAGVSDDSGGVVALVGPSGAGKSTAAVELARAGWGYVSDEVVAVGHDGTVTPLPRPVLLTDPADPSRKVALGPDELGLARCGDELRLGAVLLLDRRAGVEQASLEPVGLVDAIVALVPQISSFTRRANPLQRLARLLQGCGGVLRVVYGDAAQLHRALTTVLGPPPGDAERWAPFRAPGTRAAALMDGRIRRAPYRDAITTDDELLVLVDQTPVRLAGVGATAYEECEGGPTLTELTERVVAVHGPHPSASQLVADAVGSMVAAHAVGRGRPRPLEALRDGPSGDGAPEP